MSPEEERGKQAAPGLLFGPLLLIRAKGKYRRASLDGQPRRLSPHKSLRPFLPHRYPIRFLVVQKNPFLVYLGTKNAAILKRLSDFLTTTDLN